MSNKQKIARLEENIKLRESIIERYRREMEAKYEKLEQLKKEDEVKPVFPVNRSCGDVWIADIDVTRAGCGGGLVSRAAIVGKTFNSKDDADESVAISQARAYVIEAINKANNGDNGFKVGEDNYFYFYKHDMQSLGWTAREDCQFLDSDLSCRDISLLDDAEFKDNYKIMLGIK
jgi:hypothetical protein